jgi:hypothetical protein
VLSAVDGDTATIYEDNEAKPGYQVESRGAGQGFAIQYSPRADEIGTTGITHYEFSIRELDGQPFTARGSIKTP